jgi:two-component system, NtrC family, response regulator AtoC
MRWDGQWRTTRTSLSGTTPASTPQALVEKVASSPARTVLIYGETGTGKGLVARMIHRHLRASLEDLCRHQLRGHPESLLESELFGHERGAFTGAVERKLGLIEAANHGTVFLDEIREMDLTLQAKLLSLLDTHQFRRVGAVQPTSVDIRFIAATNKVLLSEVSRQVPRGSLLPAAGRGGEPAAAARAWGRCADPRPALHRQVQRAPTSRSIRGCRTRLRTSSAATSLARQRARARKPARADLHPRGRRHVILPPTCPTASCAPWSAGPAPEGGPPCGRGQHRRLPRGDRGFPAKLLHRALPNPGNLQEAAAALKMSRHALRHQMIKLGMQ